jgi:5-(carboxyamino)imidazole ribonucleotide synthase
MGEYVNESIGPIPLPHSSIHLLIYHPLTYSPIHPFTYICLMKKVGILGGGQLGRMLLQAAANYPVETYILENDHRCPAAHLCHHFVKGDITGFDDVYNFGKGLDAVTIEIESVNLEALEKLEAEGVAVYPKPAALKIIKNKILQKEFYRNNQIPTSEFVITQNLAELAEHTNFLPAVHKLAEGGYDGKGVVVIKTKDEIRLYTPVDMVFNQRLNLLSHQLSPAELPEKVFWKVEAIAMRLVKELKSPGIFAVEFFVDIDDNVLVNETAPRVHNSGHHSIEACYSSQFDMLWRIMLQYPLGNTDNILPAAIVNLVGENDCTGPAYYQGLEEILKMDNVFVHIYGKAETKPGRKMGHVTILSNEKQELLHKANQIKHTLKVVSEVSKV